VGEGGRRKRIATISKKWEGVVGPTILIVLLNNIDRRQTVKERKDRGKGVYNRDSRIPKIVYKITVLLGES